MANFHHNAVIKMSNHCVMQMFHSFHFVVPNDTSTTQLLYLRSGTKEDLGLARQREVCYETMSWDCQK